MSEVEEATGGKGILPVSAASEETVDSEVAAKKEVAGDSVTDSDSKTEIETMDATAVTHTTSEEKRELEEDEDDSEDAYPPPTEEESADAPVRCAVRAQVYNFEIEDEVVYYYMQVNIDGFSSPKVPESVRSAASMVLEYTIKKRYSEFAEFHRRLCGRFHVKRLPQLPSKTLKRNLDMEFIAGRKTRLNKYLRAITSRLYVFHCDLLWRFLRIYDRINARRHRYRPIHLGSFQCNDFAQPTPAVTVVDEDTSSPVLDKPLLPPPPAPADDDSEQETVEEAADDTKEDLSEAKESGVTAAPSPSPPIVIKTTATTGAMTATTSEPGFWSSLLSRIRGSGPESRIGAEREWRVVYADFLDEKSLVVVSQLHSDFTKGSWWQSSKKDEDFSTSTDGHLSAGSSKQKRARPRTSIDGRVTATVSDSDFFLGKVEVWSWNCGASDGPVFWRSPMSGVYLDSTSLVDGEFSPWVSTTAHSRFLLRANRPSTAVYVPVYKLLLVGTALGHVLMLKFDAEERQFLSIGTLPTLFAQRVTALMHLRRDEITYEAGAYAEASALHMPKGTADVQRQGRGYVYAVSEDCHLGVYDLYTGDALALVRTAASPNLALCFCWERLFVGCREKYIVSLSTLKHLGRPVPEKELFGHSKAVTCLLADERNDRLFSAAKDNAVCVWLLNKETKEYMHVQHLKSVCKSTAFRSLVLLPNRDCIAAGSDDGSVTLWHERRVKGRRVWKCLCTWKAHSSAVMHLFYVSKWSLLVSAANDGVLRAVYLPNPDSLPVVNRKGDLQDTVHCPSKDFPKPFATRMLQVYDRFDQLDATDPRPRVL